MDCLPHLHVASIHAEPGYRTVTPGIGVGCKWAYAELLAGVYLNSMPKQRPSWYALAALPYPVSPAIGVVTGYPGGPRVLGGAILRYTRHSLFVIPPTADSPLTVTYTIQL